ncbi:MAG: hypothetical protein ACIARR_13080 [Phycisphaerales bacterium JB059]
MPSPRSPKTCQLCGEDCGRRPRVKDSHGRYYCAPCAKQAARASGDRPAQIDLDDDSITIEPETRTSRGVCPSCLRPLPPDTGVCVSCSTGLNRNPSPDGSGPKCQKCGYDLTGARSLICPECGTKQSPTLARRNEHSRAIVRDAYLKPALALVLGLAFIIVFQLLIEQANAIPTVLLAILIQSVVGLVIFWICSLAWIGFDEPFHMNVLRLLAIYAISWSALLVASSLPPLLCSAILFVPAGIFALLHKKMLDLEMQDALLVSVITGIVWAVVFIILLGQAYL